MTRVNGAQQGTLTKQHLTMLFARIGAVIEAETKALKENLRGDLAEANARKNRCLYELNLVSGELARFRSDPHIALELRALAAKVAANEAVLRARMQATKDVIGILGDAISRADSDGTYPAASRLPAGYAFE
ncbi:hypothetical protein [Oricola sp.]|uniref:hypothetical protein n=1 Tax=Oricola sp. TaxID=1979950 RepID=UPI003BA8AE56